MHRRFRILLYTSIGITALIITCYLWLYSTSPDYNGSKKLDHLTDSVEVRFDEHGIPHIACKNTLDAYRTLGYLHASERQFQMELLRRAGSGRLAELLGKDLVEADVMFHTLGLPVYAKTSAEKFMAEADQKVKDEVEAYIDGINQCLKNEHRCPEFLLLGYEPEPYTIVDLYNTAGYMAFSFALGQRTDPLVNWISENLGDDYLNQMGLETYPGEKINTWTPDAAPLLDTASWQITQKMELLQELLPLPGFEASNSWAVAGSKTKNGLPILCNDTHIRHAVPNTWYEAAISCDEFEIYGHYLPGIPYCLIGHSDHHAWGITMLEQDDMDFYIEQTNPEGTHYYQDDTLRSFQEVSAGIKIKDNPDTLIHWKLSHHGPIINSVFAKESKHTLCLWWDYTKSPNLLMQSYRELGLAQNVGSFSQALSTMHSPGVNVIYADNQNNIAWWAVGKLLQRPKHVNSFNFIDGSKKENDPIGYYPFSENPHLMNPERGFVYSANEQPGMMADSTWYPGYYVVSNRSYRIHEMLETRKDWTHTAMKGMMADAISPMDGCISSRMCEIIQYLADGDAKTDLNILEQMQNWDGSHELKETAPTVYYKWLYHMLSMAMVDEMGEERFESFLGTHWKFRAITPLIENENAPWWDNVTTPEKESREQIILDAYQLTINELNKQLGADTDDWQWSAVRHIEIEHPLSQVPLLGMVFNAGPAKIKGASETIGAAGFKLSGDGFYEVTGGSQMRIVHDLSHPDSSWNVLPLGQSGHPFSEHYDDQFSDYCEFDFELRRFKLSKNKHVTSELIFLPSNGSNH